MSSSGLSSVCPFRKRWLLVACLWPSLFACAAQRAEPKVPQSGQSLAAAMELVCYVDRHIEATDDPLELQQRRHDLLASRIKHPDAIYHRTLWQVQGNAARAKAIRELAAQARLERCPYADALEADADTF